MENDDSWDKMIFRFIKEKKDWLSEHILRNRLEHQARNAQKQVKVKDTNDSKIWENLHPGNQVSTQNPPPFEVWCTKRMNKPKHSPTPSNIKDPMENSDDENVPTGRKNSKDNLPSAPPISDKRIQNWRGIAIETTWYDSLNDISKEYDNKKLDHKKPVEEQKEISKDEEIKAMEENEISDISESELTGSVKDIGNVNLGQKVVIRSLSAYHD